ncbi:MAG TPA: DUF4139 domain-containing protein [Candidatus Udaeobacter sp.]|nr:DUF4139 domain-containing protein [Candidatus Udaeobacter sp.]
MTRRVTSWFTVLIAGASLSASFAAAGPALTIYSRDLGLVRERRVLEVGGARDTLRIGDLPERIDFGSVRLVPGRGARVTRLAYRSEAGGGDGLIQSMRGHRVRVTERADRVRDGVLVSSDGSWLILRADDGTVITLARGAIEEVRFLDLPPGRVPGPGLDVTIEGARGKVDAELTYLTGGLSWNAEHVVVRRGEQGLTWSAAAIVDNATGRDFADADLELVAGEPQRAGMPMPFAARALEMSAQKGADLGEQAFSEYHLYRLGRAALLRDGESQSFSMIEPRPVRATTRYVSRSDGRGVVAEIELTNSKEAGLGVPLPGGRVRVYEADATGALRFTGESSLRPTAAGEKVTLDVGTAFDLVAERTQVSDRRISDHERESAFEIHLRNHKDHEVSITVEEPVASDAEVIAKTHEFTRKDANTLRFIVAVPAGKDVTVGYTVRTRL